MLLLADHIGRRISDFLLYAWELFKVFYLSIRSTVVGQTQSFRTIFGVISAQIYFTGYQALPLISVLSMATGAIVVMQSTSQFNILGGGDAIGQLIVLVVVREVAPLLTALIVIARSGTAVASELGNMKANREIESLSSMGIDPMSFIVFPRLFGGVISVVCLGFYFVMGSVLGGLLVAKGVQGLPIGYYFDSLTVAFTKADVFLFLAKVIFSGCIVFTIASFQGLQVKLGPHEVPQVTTKAVMNSIIAVIVFNLTLTSLFYLHHLMALGVI